MSAALKLEQQDSHVPLHAVPTPEKVSSGIKYYDEIVFPKLIKKQKVFNWYAGFFSPFWFAYKGMWKSYAIWVLPYILGTSIVEMVIKKPSIQLGLGLGFIIAVGQIANTEYYNHCKTNKTSKSNIWTGIGGLFIMTFVVLFLESFIPAFTQSFKASYNKSKNSNTRQIASEIEPIQQDTTASVAYTQSAMAVMDGEKAVGKGVSFSGMYMGLQTIDQTPVIMVSDVNGGAQWLITFGDKYKSTIAQLKVGGSYQFLCRITKIDTFNVCEME